MAIHNINMLQHQEDVKYLTGEGYQTIHYPTSNEKDFYIQSLANMGQRTGTNTSGIKYNSTTIANLFNINSDEIIAIQYVKNDEDILKAQIRKIVDTDTGYDETILDTDYNAQNIYNKYLFKNIEEFSISINNIEKYQQDSIICNDGNYMVMCLYGKILGTDDSDENNVELQYTKIDVNTGILDTAIRAYHLEDDTYIMIVIKPDEENTNIKDQIYRYKFLVTSFNTSSLEEVYDDPNSVFIDLREQIKNIFTWEKCTNKDTIFNFKYLDLDLLHCSLDDLLYYDETRLGKGENATIFGLIQHYATYHGELENNYFTSDLIYNTATDNELSFTEESKETQDYKMQYNLLIHDVYGLEGRLVSINNDIKYTYPNILSIYSRNKFDEDKTTIYVEILYTLYEHLYKECKDTDTLSSYPILYLPGDYVIEYMYNAIDYKMYYTNDIFVTFVNKEDYGIVDSTQKDNIIRNLNTIKFVYNEEEKVSCYKFIVKYNEKYEDSIDTILITEEYTLPYINSSNNWQINNKDSNLSAVGKNAGNPNIIIIKTSKTENGFEHEIIIGSNYSILKSFDWSIKEYKISNTETGYAYIPSVDKANSQYLENATILNIYIDENKNSHSSIWTIKRNNYNYENNISDDYQFVCVIDKDDEYNSALNIDKLLSLESAVDKIIENKNTLNQTVFKNGIILYSYLNTIINSSAEKLDHVECSIHGEQRNKDEDNTDSDSAINNNDAYVKIEFNKLNNKNYLKVNSSYDEDIILASTINNANYPVYELKLYTQEAGSYVARIISDPTIISTVTNNTENSNIYEIIENRQYSYDITYTDYQDETISYLFYDKSTYEYAYEYLLGDSSPTIKLGEVLLQDVNAINRTNILTIDKKKKDENTDYTIMYNSYIGSSFKDEHKNILHIGSCNTNINVGTDSLFEPGYNQHLHVQDTLSLDLKYTYINSDFTVQHTYPIISQDINDISYNFVNCNIISLVSSNPFKMFKNATNNEYSLNNNNTNEISSNPVSEMSIDTDENNNIIFKSILNKTTNTNESGMIFINTLMKKYCNVNLDDYKEILLNVQYSLIGGNTSRITQIDINENGSDLTEHNSIYYLRSTAFVKPKNYIYVGIHKILNPGSVMFINYNTTICWYVIDNKIFIYLNFGNTDLTDNKVFKSTLTQSSNNNNSVYNGHGRIDDINPNMNPNINMGINNRDDYANTSTFRI